MEIVIGIIIGVIALTLLVATHELGHGIVARRNGVVVEEFGIGFPPQAYSKVIKKVFWARMSASRSTGCRWAALLSCRASMMRLISLVIMAQQPFGKRPKFCWLA